MTVKRTPPRHHGITHLPGRVTVELDGPLVKGKRQITDEDEAALKEILHKRPVTFEDLVRPTEDMARRIIEKHGGVRGGRPTPTTLGLEMAGYFMPRDVEEMTEPWYALDVLLYLRYARSNDIDEARRYAWMAGALATEAALKFRWEAHALRGEKNLRSVRGAATMKAKLARRRSRARQWLRDVEGRRTGTTKEAAYARIERKENLQRGTVKKAVLRLRARRGRDGSPP